MATIFVGIGSNLGERMNHVQTAVAHLHTDSDWTVIIVSPWYETAAITLSPSDPQSPYINGVIALHTTLSPHIVLQRLHTIEAKMGRPLPRAKWSARTIDLDLLAYDHTILENPQLTLPHPELAKRLFVLLPLRDIAPDWLHPTLHVTVSELIEKAPAQACLKLS